MASGVSRVKTGSFNGTGAEIEINTVGFQPRKVELLNIDGLATAEWCEGMDDASMVKRVTDGTMTAPTSNGVTPQSDGFKLGADTDMNVDGELVRWVAYE